MFNVRRPASVATLTVPSMAAWHQSWRPSLTLKGDPVLGQELYPIRRFGGGRVVDVVLRGPYGPLAGDARLLGRREVELAGQSGSGTSAIRIMRGSRSIQRSLARWLASSRLRSARGFRDERLHYHWTDGDVSIVPLAPPALVPRWCSAQECPSPCQPEAWHPTAKRTWCSSNLGGTAALVGHAPSFPAARGHALSHPRRACQGPRIAFWAVSG